MTSPVIDAGRIHACTRWFFAGMGATAAVVPAVIPGMAAMWSVPVQSLLPSVPGLFVGLFVGVLCATVLAGLTALPIVLRWGAAAQVTGLAIAGLAPHPGWFIVAAVVAGVGFGMVESAATAVIRILDDAGTPRRLTSLTVIVGAVATVTPVVVLALGGAGLVRFALPAAAAVHVLALIIFRGAVFPSRPEPHSPAWLPPAPGAARVVVLLGAALFCYVGTESVLAGWSAARITAELGTGPTVAALGTSGFWLLITGGRLLGTALNEKLAPRTAAVLCCLVAGCALAVSVALGDRNTAAALFSIGIAVVACGPCYALILGVAVNTTSAAVAVQTSSALVAVGAAGGAIIPLLALTAFGGQPATVTAAGSMAAAFLLLTLAFGRKHLRRSTP